MMHHPTPSVSDGAAANVPDATSRKPAGTGCRATGALPGISVDDWELVARLLAGDEMAFTALVNHYHGSLVRLARAFVGAGDVAEDVVQETWLAVVKGLPSFEGRAALKTWIVRILTNRAKTRGQREKRWVQRLANPAEACGIPPEDHVGFTVDGDRVRRPALWRERTPEALLLQRETVEVIEQAIAGLPRAQCVVITLRDIEGLSSVDVCTLLGVSAANQRVLLHRGRTKVRAAVEWHVSGPWCAAARVHRQADRRPRHTM